MASARSLTQLPEDMLVKVTARVTASSTFPLDDLCRLRGVSSLVRDRVCGAALGRHSLNLRLVLKQEGNEETRQWVIANTYEAGNLEARFIEGMRDMFRQHDGALHPLLDDLDQAARGGHKPAAYMLAMFLWGANRGADADHRAKELLDEAANDATVATVWSGRGVCGAMEYIFDTLWADILPDNWPTDYCPPWPCFGSRCLAQFIIACTRTRI